MQLIKSDGAPVLLAPVDMAVKDGSRGFLATV